MLHFRSRYNKKHSNPIEQNLLDGFVESGFFDGFDTQRYGYTLIYEPYTGFGYADLVCLRWKRSIEKKWNTKRNQIEEKDIKILHYLYNSKKTKSFDQMHLDLGYEIRVLHRIVDRLVESDLVVQNRTGKFRISPLNDIFFIHEIIAVEAKIRDWKKALEQSFNNIFFASKSFSLFPKKTINQNMLNAYGQTDVGILSMTEGRSCRQVLKPKKMQIPASLTAWQFNEMLGREWLG
jgi:predicted transcriptional regulator